jgi:hypothetical protein
MVMAYKTMNERVINRERANLSGANSFAQFASDASLLAAGVSS